jgi:exosortase K
MNQRTKWSAQLVAVMLCALALKYFYSTAGPDQLRWILGPVAWLTSLLSGRSFSFESHAGYMSSDNTFLIAAACAGVNFLITSFLMLTLKKLWNSRQEGVSWRFIPVAVVTAYIATLVANTVRICIALELQEHPVRRDWLSPSQTHRLEGVIVYFGFLFLLFLMTETRGLTKSRLIAFPLAIYYLTTLGMPLLNGAFNRGPEFWEHATFVLLIPLIVVLPISMWKVIQSVVRTRTDKHFAG